jgi:hypothetical protein
MPSYLLHLQFVKDDESLSQMDDNQESRDDISRNIFGLANQEKGSLGIFRT